MNTKKQQYIQTILIDRILKETAGYTQVSNKGEVEVGNVSHEVGDKMEEMLKKEGYVKLHITSTLNLWSRVDRRGKVLV